jgi:hypothetical protein
MPIAHFGGGGGPSPGTGPNLPVILATVPLDPAPPTPIQKGHVVAIIEIAGSPYITLCGASIASGHPEQLFGVMDTPIAGGGSTVITGRGSLIAPFVEGSIALVPEQDVYLATTPGEVTQTAPVGPSQAIIRIGFAISATQAIWGLDVRREIP